MGISPSFGIDFICADCQRNDRQNGMSLDSDFEIDDSQLEFDSCHDIDLDEELFFCLRRELLDEDSSEIPSPNFTGEIPSPNFTGEIPSPNFTGEIPSPNFEHDIKKWTDFLSSLNFLTCTCCGKLILKNKIRTSLFNKDLLAPCQTSDGNLLVFSTSKKDSEFQSPRSGY
jgi:hypothetical protein